MRAPLLILVAAVAMTSATASATTSFGRDGDTWDGTTGTVDVSVPVAGDDAARPAFTVRHVSGTAVKVEAVRVCEVPPGGAACAPMPRLNLTNASDAWHLMRSGANATSLGIGMFLPDPQGLTSFSFPLVPNATTVPFTFSLLNWDGVGAHPALEVVFSTAGSLSGNTLTLPGAIIGWNGTANATSSGEFLPHGIPVAAHVIPGGAGTRMLWVFENGTDVWNITWEFVLTALPGGLAGGGGIPGISWLMAATTAGGVALAASRRR